MHTVKLRIDDKIYDKLLGLLRKYSKDELEIIFEDSNLQENQVEYIAIDSPERAGKFKTELLDRIKQIPLNPYQYRKSVYFEDINEIDVEERLFTFPVEWLENVNWLSTAIDIEFLNQTVQIRVIRII